MSENEKIVTSMNNGVFSVIVNGRANFEYAVPLREAAKQLGDNLLAFKVDLSDCSAMDSTFMGVLSMIGLQAYRSKSPAEIYNASEHLKKLLRNLGVNKLFKYCTGSISNDGSLTSMDMNSDMLKTAETVSEAHKALVETDESNSAVFENVIKFADQDVERLKK